MDHLQLLNVVDVEATCWPGRPPAGQVNEIIEIGVCVLDTHTWQRVERHRIIVRPSRSEVSAFCTELTGLTQAEVDAGVAFEDACTFVRDELRGKSRTWGSWGDYDRKQFERQCAGGGYPFSSRHVNIKQQFAYAYGLPRGIGMAQALQKAQLPLEGRHHRGDDHAWNIAAVAIHLATLTKD